MEADFWLNAWKIGRINFHRHEFHPKLLEFFPSFDLKKGDHVLVPLCGKSKDLLWLAQQGFKVTGIELSSIAANDFFKENDLKYTISTCGGMNKYSSGNITIFQGDIFDFNICEIKPVNAIYDRAAMVALPKNMRQEYFKKINEILPVAGKKMLITFEYDQEQVQGPPFSVTENEVRDAFESEYKIELLHQESVPINSPKMKDAGVKKVVQKVFCLTKIG